MRLISVGGKTIDTEKICEEYFSTVYRFARKLSGDPDIAAELTQETFFKAPKNLDSFQGQCEIRVWLCQICKNQFFTFGRHRKRFSDYSDAEWEKIPAPVQFAENPENREMAQAIHRILHQMKEPYKEVFTLHIFGELSFKEIGNLFEKSDSWARVTFHRAANKIRKLLVYFKV